MAYGYLCLAQGRTAEALNFGHKAITAAAHAGPATRLEGLVLKGRTLAAMGNAPSTLHHFQVFQKRPLVSEGPS